MLDAFAIDLEALCDGDTLSALGTAIKEQAMDAESAPWLRASASWLGGKAVDAIGDAVRDFDLLGAFVTAWSGAREIAERGDTIKYPQVNAKRLRLGKHDVDIVLNPKLTLKVAHWSSPPIDLTLTLTAAIEAVELRIKQGFLTAFGGGVCDLKIGLSRGSAVLLPQRSLRKFDLPGDHKFKAPGIDIRPHHLRPTSD